MAMKDTKRHLLFILVLLVGLSVALAGCADGGEDDGGQEDAGDEQEDDPGPYVRSVTPPGVDAAGPIRHRGA